MNAQPHGIGGPKHSSVLLEDLRARMRFREFRGMSMDKVLGDSGRRIVQYRVKIALREGLKNGGYIPERSERHYLRQEEVPVPQGMGRRLEPHYSSGHRRKVELIHGNPCRHLGFPSAAAA